jgi:hypothetical protein
MVGFAVISPDGGLFERAVDPLDLAVGPATVRLCKGVFDVTPFPDQANEIIASAPAAIRAPLFRPNAP